MPTYAQLRQNPVSRVLFSKRITTLEGFHDSLKNSSFLAIDTEHVAVTSEADRILHQVGLAYHPTPVYSESSLADTTSFSTSKPSLRAFYTSNQIKALTLNVNVSREKHEELIRLRGAPGLPVRRNLRFGQEQRVDLESLDAAITEFVQSCNSKRNLVLIGYAMAAEWKYMTIVFPQMMHCFSAWMDFRDIATDITSSVGVIPGLNALLKVFVYHWKDLTPGRGPPNGGVADNAGDDAVATCALADALLLSKNQERLRFRQECGRIARIFTKKRGYQTPHVRDSFVVTIRSQGPLPLAINSGMKLARHFFEYSPQATGVMSSAVAFIAFGDQEKMNAFIAATNGLALPTGDILSVERHCQENQAPQKNNKDMKEKQKLRERRKLEKAGSHVEDLGDLFS